MPATVAVYDQKTIDELKQELIDRTMELHYRIESLEASRAAFSDALRKLGWKIEELEGKKPKDAPAGWSQNVLEILDKVSRDAQREQLEKTTPGYSPESASDDYQPYSPENCGEAAKSVVDAIQRLKSDEQCEIEQLKAENQALRVENHRLRDEVERHFEEAETIKTLRELLAE